ncbi:MAG TPA: alpha/beta hydrolase [Bryobacteraceae bacterium]|nr:alpha/beta hydrolase [Bryobacteraceae bacterium]
MPLDSQAKALLDFIGITTLPGVETMTPQAARDRGKTFMEMRKQMGGVEPVHQVRDIDIPSPAGKIPARIYTPAIPAPAPALIYFHGGGWVLGDRDSHDGVCRQLANTIPCVAISVDYRLAPEAKFPAAVDDSYAAVEWIAANAASLGIDPNRIAVGGDSAGGNLSAVACQLARDRKGPRLLYQLLIYPATDMRMNLPSIEENAAGPLLTKASMVWFMNHYLTSEQDKLNPLASPLLAANLRDLPPAFVLTAECDPLRDEGEAYAKKLRESGVTADSKCYAGMPHGFFSFGAALTQAKEAVEDSAARLRAAFGLALHHDSAA